MAVVLRQALALGLEELLAEGFQIRSPRSVAEEPAEVAAVVVYSSLIPRKSK